MDHHWIIWDLPKRCLSAPMGWTFAGGAGGAGGASALGGATGGAAVAGGAATAVLGWKEGCLETAPVRQETMEYLTSPKITNKNWDRYG